MWKRMYQSWCHCRQAKRPWMCNCTMPSTGNQSGYNQVPPLPRNWRRTPGDKSGPSTAPYHECHACHAERRSMWVCATLGSNINVNVNKCHACHAKWDGHRWQIRTKRGTQYHECHACHAKKSKCELVPAEPRDIKVNVTKCHACHANWRAKSGPSAPHSTMSATPSKKKQWMWACATLAMWNEHECHHVRRLPRKVTRRPRWQMRTKRATNTMSAMLPTEKDGGCVLVSATPAAWYYGECHQAPRQPRKGAPRPRRQTRTKCATQNNECDSCHARPSATRAIHTALRHRGHIWTKYFLFFTVLIIPDLLRKDGDQRTPVHNVLCLPPKVAQREGRQALIRALPWQYPAKRPRIARVYIRPLGSTKCLMPVTVLVAYVSD